MSMRQFQRRFGKKDAPAVCYQNTFRVDGEEETPFTSHEVVATMEDALREHLAEVTYDPVTVKELVPGLSNAIKSRVKALEYTRHRIVCTVTIGQNLGQGVEFASRCLWDDSRDSWACASFTSETVFAIATVHGVYFE